MLDNSDAKVVVVEDDEQLAKIDEVRDRLPTLEHDRDHGGRSRGRDLLRQLAARGDGRDEASGEARYEGVSGDGRLHLHLHVGDDRTAQGLRDQPRQLPGDARHDGQGDRARARGDRLPVPPPRALVRAADPARQLRHRRRHRLLGARPAEDRPEPPEVHPHYFPSVPRIFEKIYTTATERDRQAGRHRERIFWWAIGVGSKVREMERPAASPASCCSASTRSPTSRC